MVTAVVVALAGSAMAASLLSIPNPPTNYPPGELGWMVKLDEDIIMHPDTHPLTKALVCATLQ